MGRTIFFALAATAGFQVVNRIDASASTGKILLFVFLWAGVGYVLGGIMGRLTAKTVSSTERDLRRATPAELAAGTAGLIAGLVIAALVTIPLFRLPAGAAWPATAFVYITLSALGYRIGDAVYTPDVHDIPAESWPRFWISKSMRGMSRETSSGPCSGHSGLLPRPLKWYTAATPHS